MDTKEIEALIAAFATTDLVAMEIEREGWKLRLERAADGGVRRLAPVAVRATASATPAPAAPTDSPAGTPAPVEAVLVRAPLAGVVHLAPAPGAAPFVAVGEQVEAGRVVAILEAMKVLSEIRAPCAGVVLAVLVASGEEVEAGRPLLRIG